MLQPDSPRIAILPGKAKLADSEWMRSNACEKLRSGVPVKQADLENRYDL
jgi:hypothetical protein